MTVTLTTGPCESCGATHSKRQTIGYAQAFTDYGIDPFDFPVLSRALADAKPAHNPKIEWLTNGHTAANYCQIIRTPYGYTSAQQASVLYGFDPEKDERAHLLEHLRTVEQTLTFGVPSNDIGSGGYTVRLCGGVWHFLGRLPRRDDTVSLRILRDLMFAANVQAPDYDGVKHEWLSEVSLLAYRA